MNTSEKYDAPISSWEKSHHYNFSTKIHYDIIHHEHDNSNDTFSDSNVPRLYQTENSNEYLSL